ncbi:MAG: IS1 family transposase, partial [Alphaproteobacteria bacterium]
RMQQRRFTRLTSGFSKKLRNHKAAVSLYVAHYNLCRVHESLRMTPAMALGVTDHIWTIGELIEAATGPDPVGRQVGRFRVIDGGLS